MKDENEIMFYPIEDEKKMFVGFIRAKSKAEVRHTLNRLGKKSYEQTGLPIGIPKTKNWQ